MTKLLKSLSGKIRKIINFQVRLILSASYFILLAPYGVFVAMFKNYLGIKEKPYWKQSKEITNIHNFLNEQ